jgi:hypothetical protein
MIIKELNGVVVLYSEGDNKITNIHRTFFANLVYLGKNDSIDNYEEVPYDVWRNYLFDSISTNELEKLNKEILALKEEAKMLKQENTLLVGLLLENDYRISQELTLLKSSQK